MIQLKRTRIAQAIAVGLRGARRKEKAIALLKQFYSGTFEFKSDYWKKAKDQLKVESNGKCAYCETPTDVVAHGDVEHFRPKSKYWWLAYCYDNYSYSCQICNQVYKSDKFEKQGAELVPPQNLPAIEPDDAEKALIAHLLFPDPLNDADGFPYADFKNVCEQEKPHLVDPYMFDPESFFKWEVLEVGTELRELRIAARDETQQCQNAFRAAKEDLGLNRETLCKQRYQKYKTLETFKIAFESVEIPQQIRDAVKVELQKMTSNEAPFAGMARYFVKDVWNLNLQ